MLGDILSYRFGSHVSCQGGLLKAIERAEQVGCDCLQVFVCQPRQWPSSQGCIPVLPAPQIDSHAVDAVTLFTAQLRAKAIPAPLAHASYLINLASSDDALWEKSLQALEVEWRRAESLELSGLVLHPGSFLKSTLEAGVDRVVSAIDAMLERIQPRHCPLLLENTAGQGSCLGWRFEQLGWIFQRLERPDRVGVCFDTCHAFAAGYDFSTAAKVKAMWASFDECIGLERLKAIHINDSVKGLGSRVDRHAHIGQGAIGEAAFKHFLRSSPAKDLPMILETPKGIDPETGEDLDVQNLATLRRLAGTKARGGR